MSDAAEFFAQQDSALIVRVPEAEPIVGPWRTQHDSSAAAGVPAHVTVLFPWIPVGRIDADVLSDMADLIARFEPFTVEFGRVERIPDVIWMRPDPEAPFRDLTEAVSLTWPDFPPYRGRFDDVIPHLTIAETDVPNIPGTLEETIRPHLPIRTVVTEIELLAFAGDQWTVSATFPLGG